MRLDRLISHKAMIGSSYVKLFDISHARRDGSHGTCRDSVIIG
mgnify:CR=1 FL=1